MAVMAGRTPQQVFQHYAQVLMAADLDGIVEDYAEDAVFITPAGAKHGKEGVREAFAGLLEELPDAQWQVPTRIFEDDVLFIEWQVDSPVAKVEDGIDTFIFRDGLIRAQTVRYTRVPK